MQNWGTIGLIILLELNIPGCMQKVFIPRKCKLPPKKGKCNADFENFYYDYKNNMCFFSTWENIVGDLQWKKKIPRECKLRARKGRCKGKITRYYYDAFNKRCRLFTYGGCGGNANNFRTFNDCNMACDMFGNKMKHFYPEFMLQTCDQPLDVGPCKESFPRFYYDCTTKICKPFKFGGCNGNRNNFLSHEDCVQECKSV
ncbi:boophilin-G2-like isoform X2 [Crotalus tigris]|uniref:boophilin-G2-like isoform X2 n=1 Tax=Crotalus tigris TaxID=88082 RepID=UPI00192F7044|nr:boophilin-G2-like isoform X2 [Crotalus tigris]